MKPRTWRNETLKRGRPDQMVAIQQKICSPEGIAIIMLAALKKL
jgi:hypothetical protein